MRGLVFKNTEDPSRLIKLARERGLLLLSAGTDAVRLVPSLNIGLAEVDTAFDIIESCLTILEKEQ